MFAYIIFSKGLNCCILNYIRLEEQRCPYLMLRSCAEDNEREQEPDKDER